MKNIIVISILMLLASVCFGQTYITCNSDTGLTAYSVIYDSAIALYEIGAEPQIFVAEASATWTDCDIPMTEGTNLKGLYTVAFPELGTAGRYYVRTYSQLGATPAITDPLIGYDIYDFDGTNEIKVGDNTEWLGSPVVPTTVPGVPEVDMTHINGLTTNGNNATLSLKAINVTNTTGNAVTLSSSSALGAGLYCSGTSGYGFKAITDSGIGFVALGGTGSGMWVNGDTRADVNINIRGYIGSLDTQAKADIKAEADTAISDAALAKTSELASVKLASDGLDNITNSEPAVWPPQTIKDTINAIYRWYFNKKTATTTEIRLYGDDGETVIMTKPVNYDGVTKTVGKPE